MTKGWKSRWQGKRWRWKKIKKRRRKKNQKEYEQKILSLRAKEIDSKLEVKSGEGEVQALKWKRITVDEYIGQGI